MALEANRILVRSRSKLARNQRPVRIVTIIALDQALFHAMVERLLEVGSLLGMA
jgi:hypothetical protein